MDETVQVVRRKSERIVVLVYEHRDGLVDRAGVVIIMLRQLERVDKVDGEASSADCRRLSMTTSGVAERTHVECRLARRRLD